MKEDKKDFKCLNQALLTCPTCKIELDKAYLGERCPRCNSVVLPESCSGCKNFCK